MFQDLVDLQPLADFASSELATLTAGLVDGTREWREEMEMVPCTSAALQYSPRPGWHSAGSVLAHIADVEARWMERLGLPRPPHDRDRFNMHLTDLEKPFWPDAGGDYLAILGWQDEVRLRTLAFLQDMTEDQVTAFREDRPDYSAAWVVNHLIGHEAYHGGQAVLLAMLSEA